MRNYHRLFFANQERSDKINSAYNSAGYHSLKSGGGSDDSDIFLDTVDVYKAGMTEGDQVCVFNFFTVAILLEAELSSCCPFQDVRNRAQSY